MLYGQKLSGNWRLFCSRSHHQPTTIHVRTYKESSRSNSVLACKLVVSSHWVWYGVVVVLRLLIIWRRASTVMPEMSVLRKFECVDQYESRSVYLTRSYAMDVRSEMQKLFFSRIYTDNTINCRRICKQVKALWISRDLLATGCVLNSVCLRHVWLAGVTTIKSDWRKCFT